MRVNLTTQSFVKRKSKVIRIVFIVLLTISLSQVIVAQENNDISNYFQYHTQIIEAERSIGEDQFKEALIMYERVFDTYDFAFLRDYQVTTQLALFLNEKQRAFDFLRKGILAGWELKSIKKNRYLSRLTKEPEWESIMGSYEDLRKEYESKLNQPLRERSKEMFAKDQRKALGALFRIGNKAQTKYSEKKFAPHSEKQVLELIEILGTTGFPGERIIGNNYWMATILSHHNSISKEYSMEDTLYSFIKPKLIEAIRVGQMSPYEFAMIDDWFKKVISDSTEPGYGFLYPLHQSSLEETNELRGKIGLRSVEIRNKLLDIEQRTGMNFYLPGKPWVEGKMEIKE